MTWIRDHLTGRVNPAIQRAEAMRADLWAEVTERERRAAQLEADARASHNELVEWVETGTVRPGRSGGRSER